MDQFITHKGLSRRGLLGLGLATTATLVLPACSSGGGTTENAGGQLDKAKLPKYVAPPEIPGGLVSKVEGMPTIFTAPPTSYTKSVSAPPGTGKPVTTFQVLWAEPPRTIAKGNVYWAEINKRLNVDFKPNLAPSGQYNDKMATTFASGEIPDLTFVQDTTPVGIQAIEDGAFADLTDVLAGDGVLEYPNLANVGTHAWSASSKGGKIYGVPNENPYLTNFPIIRWDLVKAAGHDKIPADADGLLEMFADIAKLKQVNGKRHWVLGGIDGKTQGVFEWMFRAGTTWQADSAGKLTNIIETDQFVQVMEYENKLWQNGVFHPDAFGQSIGDLFTGGQIAMSVDSFSGFFGNPIIGQVKEQTPGAELQFFVPPAFDGGKLIIPRDPGYWGFVAISASAAEDEARLKELLGILNYWRAPYGSEENLFITSGVEGFNYKLGPNSSIVPLKDPKADFDKLAVMWLGCFNSPVYNIPAALTDQTDNFRTTMEALVGMTVEDPVNGLYSETQTTNDPRLQEIHTNYRNGMVTGRIKITDMAKYRDEWRKAGGDKVREELQTALQAKNG